MKDGRLLSSAGRDAAGAALHGDGVRRLWLAFAALLSWSLRSAVQLTPIYGSFAGVVATLIFFYMSAATIIFGAEVSGVIQAEKNQGNKKV